MIGVLKAEFSGVSRVSAYLPWRCIRARVFRTTRDGRCRVRSAHRQFSPLRPNRSGRINGGLRKELRKMRSKSKATLLALPVILLMAVPAFARQVAQPVDSSRFSQHEDAACHEPVFGACLGTEAGARCRSLPKMTQDDWPANMILDHF